MKSEGIQLPIEAVTRIPLRVVTGQLSPAPGTAELTEWSRRRRIERALRYSGLLVLIALITLPIPGVHFIVPPICLLCIPAAFTAAMRANRTITGGDFTCPQCGERSDLFKTAANFPLRQNCTHRARALEIQANLGA